MTHFFNILNSVKNFMPHKIFNHKILSIKKGNRLGFLFVQFKKLIILQQMQKRQQQLQQQKRQHQQLC